MEILRGMKSEKLFSKINNSLIFNALSLPTADFIPADY